MKGFPFLLIVLSSLILSACGVGEAENIADEFHARLDAKDYTYIVKNLVDSETLAETGEDAWYNLFDQMELNWGPVSERDQNYGFKSRYNDGITQVQLDYENKYGSKTVYERIFLADRGEGFKISGIFLNENKAEMERQAGELN